MDYKTLVIRGARIMPGNWRHFEGGRYGYSFCIDLSEADEVTFGNQIYSDPNELIAALEADQWKVQYTNPSSDAYDPTPYLNVKINFNNKVRPPYIFVDGVGYNEKMLPQLQKARFAHTNVAVNPSRPTERNDGTMKRTAYLSSLHIDLANDDGEYAPDRFPDPFA